MVSKYRQFHNTLPEYSLLDHYISARNMETACNIAIVFDINCRSCRSDTLPKLCIMRRGSYKRIVLLPLHYSAQCPVGNIPIVYTGQRPRPAPPPPHPPDGRAAWKGRGAELG